MRVVKKNRPSWLSIKEGTKFISEIMNDTNLNEREILELISILELEGVVRSIPGGRWKIT